MLFVYHNYRIKTINGSNIFYESWSNRKFKIFEKFKKNILFPLTFGLINVLDLKTNFYILYYILRLFYY